MISFIINLPLALNPITFINYKNSTLYVNNIAVYISML